MKKIELIFIKLRNFKGIRQLDVEVNRENARIYGDNATGKTTVFDGFLWLLFDKDSNNDSKFAIQTLTGAGHKVHNLEHTVEAELLVDGVPVKLKKVFKEKWTKPRGKVHQEFGGYTTSHYVDDVPLKQKEYVAKIQEIVEEETFKLLTSPTYFNEQLKDGWKKRRQILLEVCGDISNEEVISTDDSLKRLGTILSGKSLEDMKKIIAEKKKDIKKELDTIPVRIDEIHKMIPDVLVDAASLTAQVGKLETEINELKDQRYAVTNGSALLDKQHQLKELEMKLADFKRTFEADSLQEIYTLRAGVQEDEGNLQIFEKELERSLRLKKHCEDELVDTQNKFQKSESERNALRDEWMKVNSKQFVYEDKCECPTCKQTLPSEEVDRIRNEALAQFNERKAFELNSIAQKGNECKNQSLEYASILEGLESELEKRESLVQVAQSNLDQKLKELEKSKQRLQQAQTAVPDVTATESYQGILSEINLTQAVIAEMKANASEVVADIDTNIRQLEEEKRSINAELGQLANAQNQRKRITELEADQQRLAAEYEALEGNLFLIESFTRKKVEMLTERINSKFKHARFKLFEEQVNGGLNEVCETLYEGVPYGSGLNNAAKINVGLDIINTLSTHYGILAPIFVDNAEAVTKFIDVESQLISLVVSEQDKQLRIETDPVQLKEAI